MILSEDAVYLPDGTIYHVPESNIWFTIQSVAGPMVSHDGKTWGFTFRGLEEFKRMWPTLTPVQTPS